MSPIVSFVIILLVDSVVFKVLVNKMADDLDIEVDFAESFKHCLIATLVGTVVRMLDWSLPVHYIYFYHIFYNKYGLNTVAVIVSLVIMGVVEFMVLIGLKAALAGAI